MSLTVSNKIWSGLRDKRVLMCTVAFDISYAYGGESFDYTTMAMSAVDQVNILPMGDYSFEFDYTNKKIKVFQRAPALVVEEQQTIATLTITLNYPAAYIISVAQANANIALTTSGATLAANQCKPTAVFAAGERSGLTFHAGVTGVVYVTYITQAWKEVWDNLVQEEAATVTTNSAVIAYNAVAVQCVKTDNANCLYMNDVADTPLSGEVNINWTPETGKTYFLFAAGEADNPVVTYIKKPASGFLLERWVENELFTATTNVNTPAYPILLWSYGGHAPEKTFQTSRLINIKGTVGTSEAYINFWDPYTKITGKAFVSGDGTYIKGWPHEIPNLVPLEVRNAEDLSGLTGVKVICIGR